MQTQHFSPGQRFDCSMCGKCCGGWQVLADKESRAKIRGSQLELRVIAETGGPVFVPAGRLRQLAQTPKGRCVFLNSQRLCSVQAELGAPSKPLGCQKFPFLFTPTPDGVFVGVSFYCDAAQRNEGRELSHHADSIAAMLDLELPVGEEPMPVHRRVTMGWPAYRVFEQSVVADLPGALGKLAALVGNCRGRTLEITEKQLSVQSLPTDGLASVAAVVETFWPALIEPLGTDGLESALPDWAQAELDRYLQGLIFRKFLVAERPILHNLSCLYLVPRLFGLCAGWNQRLRGAPELEKVDVYQAFEACEYHFVTHVNNLDKTYARLAQALAAALRVFVPPKGTRRLE